MFLTGYHAIEEQLKRALKKSTLYVSSKNGRIVEIIKIAQKTGAAVE